MLFFCLFVLVIICLVQIDVLKEILIAASQLSMTDGEFVFVGFKSDIDAEPNYPPQLWGKPDFYEEPSKCSVHPFSDIIFFKEAGSPLKLDDEC